MSRALGPAISSRSAAGVSRWPCVRRGRSPVPHPGSASCARRGRSRLLRGASSWSSSDLLPEESASSPCLLSDRPRRRATQSPGSCSSGHSSARPTVARLDLPEEPRHLPPIVRIHRQHVDHVAQSSPCHHGNGAAARRSRRGRPGRESGRDGGRRAIYTVWFGVSLNASSKSRVMAR